MARRTLGNLMASAPDVDRARLMAATEHDIRGHAREDGHDPDEEADGYELVLAPKAVRERLGLTQAAFAEALRIPIGTVRNWEQSRTLPDPAARSLLTAVAAEPEVVLRTLRRIAVRLPERRVHRMSLQVGDASPKDDFHDDIAKPLEWIARCRDRHGRLLFDAVDCLAGERLRRDLVQANLIPRAEAARDAPEVGGNSIGLTVGSDHTLAARQRARCTLDAVGTELAGFLIDLCGFLKGLERVEAERRWPSGSAIVVAQIALGRLAEHYGLGTNSPEVERDGVFPPLEGAGAGGPMLE